VLDTQSLTFGSDACTLSKSEFIGCQSGVILSDNAVHWKLDGLHIENPSSIGINLLVHTASPSGTTISNCDIIGSGNQGIVLQNADDTTILNTRITSSTGVALQVNSGVTHTQVRGGRWDLNGQIGAFSGDVVISDLYAKDNTQGVSQTVAANLVATNVWQIVDASGTTGSYDAWNLQASSFWNLTNCIVDFTSSTGIKIGAITSAGRMDLYNFMVLEPSHAASSFSLFINGGGEIRYDTNSLIDTTTNGLSGGTVVASNGTLNRYH
jgi:parallel beta-helix repeat protein